MSEDDHTDIEETDVDMTPFLANEAISYAATNGANLMTNRALFQSSHVPMTLFPTSFPSGLFEFAKMLAPVYNKLADKIARNQCFGDGAEQPSKKSRTDAKRTWLEETLETTIKTDDFTRQLMEIHVETQKMKEEDPESFQEVALAVNRSDYMVNEDPSSSGTRRELLQVELNTMASSFAFTGQTVSESHKYLCSRYPDLTRKAMDLTHPLPEAVKKDTKLLLSSMPENNMQEEITCALAKAHELFRNQLKFGATSAKVCILFIVQETEKNIFDQRRLEYKLLKDHDVKVMMLSLKEIYRRGTLSEVRKKKNVLVIDGYTVSIAYFRAGYSPNDYYTFTKVNGEEICEEWEGRKLIERSFAIKCPTIAYHLAGTKKVQQQIAAPGEVERFLNTEESLLLRRSFAKLWTLDEGEQGEDDLKHEKLASDSKTSNGYVLKPQREGGGNNFYGEEIPKMLEKLSSEEKAGYILMQRIFPTPSPVKLLRNGELAEGKGVVELGMFSVFVGDGKSDYTNSFAGYLTKVKFEDSDEGGVAAGFSCVGSVHLF